MTPPTWPAWLESLSASGGLHRLGWVVLHSLWQAAAVAAVLAVALRLLPRRTAFGQEARYLLATLALFSLPVACGVTWTLVEPPRQPPRAVADRGPQPGPELVIPAALARSLARANVAAASDSEASAPAVAAAPAAESTASLSTSAAVGILAARAAAVAEPWLPTCAAVWLAGVLAAALRLVVGWLRPVVIWPVAAVTGMPPEQIDAILAHELPHVRRHDVLVNLLQSAIEAAFFHHPAAWWISAQVRAEREHCADELAIRGLAAGKTGSRISYATALLSLEERRQAILAAAANGGSQGDRIRRLAGIEQQGGHPARLAAAALVLVALVAALATPPGGSGRQAVAAAADSGEPAAREATGTAQEPPEDTNQIESLTPEQARKLAREFPGVEVEFEFAPGQSRGLPGCLPLNGLKSLNAETAKALAGYDRGPLLLNGLTTLDAITAKALADFKGYSLSLDGVTTLDAITAKALAEFKGDSLRLSGLTTLDADAARALAEFKGRMLFLFGLTTLDAATAKALAESTAWDGSLSRLTTLDAVTAKALAEFKGRSLALNGLTTLDAATATALAEFKGGLDLSGVTTLDADTAKALALIDGRLLLSDHFKKAFVAKNPLTPDTALAWAGLLSGDLSGVTALDSPDSVAVAVAQALAVRKGPLSLPNLKKISPKTLAALLAKEDVEIPLIETLELIPEPDGSATEDFVIPDGFRQR